MARVLVLYTTVEGQTARIAERIAHRLHHRGLVVALQRVEPADADLDLDSYLVTTLPRCDGVIVGASIHYGRHPSYLRALLRDHRAELAARPAAFFSVSLSAGGPGAKPEAARRYLDSFLSQVGWRPRQTATFAGALPYSRFGVFKRMLVLAFVGMAGGDTDTARDYEYTDWNAVERFTDEFARTLDAPAPAAAHATVKPA